MIYLVRLISLRLIVKSKQISKKLEASLKDPFPKTQLLDTVYKSNE